MRRPCSVSRSNFNPRSHEGSDKKVVAHGPVFCGFQSTLPRGERLSIQRVLRRAFQFQSTLPRGERPCAPDTWTISGNFNPRSHEGSDCISIQHAAGYQKFQSTLPRGERQQFSPKIFFSLSKNCLIHLFFITNSLN